MENIFSYTFPVFILTAALSVFLFYKACNNSKKVLLVLLGWALLQSAIAMGGFYSKTDGLPPRIMLAVVPAFLTIIFIFATKKGRSFVDRIDLGEMTLLSVVRIPVELVLFWLFLSGAAPEAMTFEGSNFDILSGITAPVIYFLVFRKRALGKRALLAWNFVCLGLLINIIRIAVLSVPSDFQQMSFEQPNIAVLYFPYVLLPAVIVPTVLFSHLASIRQLLRMKKQKTSRANIARLSS
jgi:hypothetical protein